MLEVGFIVGFIGGAGLVAILVGVIAEKSGRKVQTIIICIFLAIVIVLAAFWLENVWVLLFGGMIFVGSLFYAQGLVEEKARKKKEEREKEKGTDQNST